MACVQLGQHCRINPVRLDACLGDEPYQQWIRNCDTRDARAQYVDDGGGIARRFEHHMIGAAQACGKALQFVASEPGTATSMQHAVLQIRDLGHGARNIQSYDSHNRSPIQMNVGSRWDSTTTTDSRSQRNRAGRRGGQLLTRARGSSYNNGLPTRSAPRCPLSRMVTPYARNARRGTVRHRLYHAGYECH